MKSESKAEDLFGSTLRNDIDKKMRIKTFGISKKQIKGKFFIVKQTEHEVKCKEYGEGL